MTEPDWKQLEKLWQSSEAAAPAIDIIAKQTRRRWIARLLFYSEIVIVIVAAAASLLLMTLDRPFALLLGGTALLFTLFAGAASLWARFPRRARLDDSVTAVLDAAIDRARASVRWGLASFWVVVACLLYLAVAVVLLASLPELPAEHTRHVLYAVAFGCVWAGGGQAFAIVYYLRRVRELARLEEIKRALAQEVL